MILDLLNSYTPINIEETNDLKIMKQFYNTYKENSLLRENEIGHFTASAWIVNKNFSKVLFGYHIIYDNWGWLGGHSDGMEDLLARGLLEAKEESGISDIKAVLNTPISIEILPVAPHYKNNKFVSAHLHFNLTFLYMADENDILSYNPHEHKGIKWVLLDNALNETNEECMKPIYKKLINFIKNYNK